MKKTINLFLNDSFLFLIISFYSFLDMVECIYYPFYNRLHIAENLLSSFLLNGRYLGYAVSPYIGLTIDLILNFKKLTLDISHC